MIDQTIAEIEARIHAADGIRASVKQFETSHPTLTLTANGLSTYLANIGL